MSTNESQEFRSPSLAQPAQPPAPQPVLAPESAVSSPSAAAPPFAPSHRSVPRSSNPISAVPDASSVPPKPGPVLVYDLRRTGPDGARFYHELAAFTRLLLAEIDRRAAPAIAGYEAHLVSALREPARTPGEYAIDLLTVGMVLRLYGDAAAETPGWVIDLAQELVFLRRRSPGAKPLLDFARAGIFQLFMTRGLPARRTTPSDPASSLAPSTALACSDRHTFAALSRVIAWMQATGEFHQEARRLANWLSYLRTVPPLEAEGWIVTALAAFDWFQTGAQAALGPWTDSIRTFLASTWADRFWREDQIFCARQPAEYHLAMVASEIMNAAMHAEFGARPRKILLVPACMRGKNAQSCPAHVDGPDMSCAACDPDCPVHRITQAMRAEGVETYIVPHSSGFSQSLERWQRDPKVAVAAVACVPNLLAGGLEIRARGIPSQCVPLDYPGCRKHWTDTGLPTTLDEARLVHLVTGRPPAPSDVF